MGEFGLIERIERAAGGLASRAVVVGIGDDAAVLRPRDGEDLVVSTDALVEGVHFRLERVAATTVGRRAVVVNLSDLAAMGARPLACTLALAAPGGLSLAAFDGMLSGLVREAAAYGCPLVGGNIARASESSLTLTVLGAVERGRCLRRRARVGDRLFVTGALGAATLSRTRAERRGGRDRHCPVPRLDAGRRLARMPGPAGCIDISDGLVSDLRQLLSSSRLGAEVDVADVPAPRGFAAACAKAGLAADAARLAGGEDYELLFCLPPSAPSAAVLAHKLGVRVSEIGRVTRQAGLTGLPELDGWSHF